MESLAVGIRSTMGYVLGSPLGLVVVTLPLVFRPAMIVHWTLSSKPMIRSFVEESPAMSRMMVPGCL
jgi:hypothetical protein